MKNIRITLTLNVREDTDNQSLIEDVVDAVKVRNLYEDEKVEEYKVEEI